MPGVIAWLDEQDETSLFISVITLGEIEKGILKLSAADPRRSQKLTGWRGNVEQRIDRHAQRLGFRPVPPGTQSLGLVVPQPGFST